MSGVEAAANRLRAQLAAADAAVNEKDATLSLLIADKAYLSKEVQVGNLCSLIRCYHLLLLDWPADSADHLVSRAMQRDEEEHNTFVLA